MNLNSSIFEMPRMKHIYNVILGQRTKLEENVQSIAK
jgi:hypothetical protein